jgi:TatD DNase family protein
VKSGFTYNIKKFMKTDLIDTHCHLDFKDFDGDREEAIKRARDGGVKKIINIGCNLERAKKSLEIAQKHELIFSSCGLHPQEAELGDEKFFAEMEKLLKEPKVVAIGECGLEFFGEYNDPTLREKQKKIFLKQLDLAEEFNKPVIIHCRRAYPEIIEILKEEKKKNPNLSGVVHCFVGRLSQAEEFLKLGFLISFTGIITYARDYDKVIKSVPLEKIMVETDAPFIAPLPYRDQRNEPLYVKYVAKKIAELKELDFDGLAEITTKNAETLFGI